MGLLRASRRAVRGAEELGRAVGSRLMSRFLASLSCARPSRRGFVQPREVRGGDREKRWPLTVSSPLSLPERTPRVMLTAAVLLALALPNVATYRHFPGSTELKAPSSPATTLFAATGRVQYFTAQTTGTYSFTVAGAGADGGGASNPAASGGRGAVVTGTALLAAGDVLAILVGSPPPVGSCGGAGGSFVARVSGSAMGMETHALLAAASPLFVAGGGGRHSNAFVSDASLTPAGKAGSVAGGEGGCGGGSKAASSDAPSCGGGGFFSPGASPSKLPLSGFFDARFWGDRSLLPCGGGGAFTSGGLGGVGGPPRLRHIQGRWPRGRV